MVKIWQRISLDSRLLLAADPVTASSQESDIFKKADNPHFLPISFALTETIGRFLRCQLTLLGTRARIYPSDSVGLKSNTLSYKRIKQPQRCQEKGAANVTCFNQRRIWGSDNGRSGPSLWRTASFTLRYFASRGFAAGLPGTI